MNWSLILLIAALVLFILATVGVNGKHFATGWAGAVCMTLYLGAGVFGT